MRYSVAVALTLISLPSPSSAQPAASGYYEPEITPEDREHWSFKLPIRPTPPTVKAIVKVRNPIDSFILAKLEALGLPSAPPANRRTLIRRVTFDLTGLPPTLAEIEAFLKDNSPDAYEKVVDRLLASPHYGEQWAQHWLDIVRFAESNGYEADAERPQAWRYRDYVIRSLNADKPYDRFLTEQIAGDELAKGKDARECADLLVATGLHRCGPNHMTGGNLEKEMVRQEMLTEMVNGIGSAVLGLTLGCARCHDHKFDPVSQADYYRMQAFFAAVELKDADIATAEEKREVKWRADELTARIAPLKNAIAALDKPVREALVKKKKEMLDPLTLKAVDTPAAKRTPEQKRLVEEVSRVIKVTWDEILAAMGEEDRARRADLRETIHALEAGRPPPASSAWCIDNGSTVPLTHVLKRGDVSRKATVVTPNVPRVLTKKIGEPKTRLELARWLTSVENPLTARAIVNRLWQHHFGRGIAASPNDFGLRGDRPTHPKLLDWLACELMSPSASIGAAPWSLKHLHRLMVTSAAYQLASTGIPHSAFRIPHSKDPGNKLLWRMNRRRLEAESVRDATLAAAGTLNPALGGRSIKIPLEKEVYDLIFTEGEPDGLWPVTPDPAQHTRRSIYLFNKRNVRQPILEAFDQPDTLSPCAARPISTFAPQALILMNGPFVQEQSKALALRLTRECGTDVEKQIETLYARALGRAPKAEETNLARSFLSGQAELVRDRLRARLPIGLSADLPSGVDPAKPRALADLCAVLFNTNEFVYVQ